MGTPGKVVSNTVADVLVVVKNKDGTTTEKRSKANIQGMIVLDEPTYNQLWKMWQAREKVDVDVTPGVKP